MTNQHKGLLLVGLLVAWGSLTAYEMLESSGTSPSDQGNIAATNSMLPSVQALTLAESFPNARQLVKFSQPRNIFSPIGSRKIASKKISIPKRRPQSNSIVAPPPPAPTISSPSPEELAAQRARQELNKFRFLGYLTKGGESQAFLTNGQAIYIVKQGEMLEGQVQVNRIEPETIVLSAEVWEAGNQVQATIPLTPESNS